MAMYPTDKSQVGTSRKWHKAKSRHKVIVKKFNVLHNNVPVQQESPVVERFRKTGSAISSTVESVGSGLRSAFRKFLKTGGSKTP